MKVARGKALVPPIAGLSVSELTEPRGGSMNATGTIDNAVREVVREELRRGLREEMRLVIQELQSATPAQKEFLSVQEAAELFDVSETTVREWLANGLRRYGQGRVLRIRRNELLAFLSVNPPEAKEAIDVEERAVAILTRARGG